MIWTSKSPAEIKAKMEEINAALLDGSLTDQRSTRQAVSN